MMPFPTHSWNLWLKLVHKKVLSTHVALVYSHLEEQEAHWGAVLETLAKTGASLFRYASIGSIIPFTKDWFLAIFSNQNRERKILTPSLRVRRKVGANEEEMSQYNEEKAGSILDVIKQLDFDVATYICHNELRERVKGFVHEALLRLCCRDDLANVIINSHSQGSVVAYDVLRQLPPFAANKVKCFVTVGSPLRKYADLYDWGTNASCIFEMNWKNF